MVFNQIKRDTSAVMIKTGTFDLVTSSVKTAQVQDEWVSQLGMLTENSIKTLNLN